MLALLLPCAERSPSLERTESWNLISELIENGADINAKTNAGDTALMMAAALGHGETLEYLLRKGADRSIRKNVRPPCSPLHCSPTCVHHRATRHAIGLRACNERGAASGCLSRSRSRSPCCTRGGGCQRNVHSVIKPSSLIAQRLRDPA